MTPREPLFEPCPHHTPNAGGSVASELHGVCIFCWRDWWAESRARWAEVEAENERLRGALRPLALVGDLDFGRVSADVRLYSRRSYTRERGDEEVCITVADARRARAALSPVKP